MKAPVFYIYLQKMFIDYAHNDGTLDRIVASNIILQKYRVPKTLRQAILKEMENAGLIEKVNRDVLRVINKEMSKVLDNTTQMFTRVGILS